MKLDEIKDALKEACLDRYGCGYYDIDYLPEMFSSKLEEVENGAKK